MNFAAPGMMHGPALSFVSVFVVNLILALLGHGSITAVGINTLTIGIEAALGEPCLNILKQIWRHCFCCHFYAVCTSAVYSSYNIVSKFNWCGRYMVRGRAAAYEEHEDHGSGDVVYRLGFVILTGWGAYWPLFWREYYWKP